MLLERMGELGLKEDDYSAYLDTRRFGSQPHLTNPNPNPNQVEKSLSGKLADSIGLSWLKGATGSLGDSTSQSMDKAGGLFKGNRGALEPYRPSPRPDPHRHRHRHPHPHPHPHPHSHPHPHPHPNPRWHGDDTPQARGARSAEGGESSSTSTT